MQHITVLEIGNKKTGSIKIFCFPNYKMAVVLLDALRMIRIDDGHIRPDADHDDKSDRFERIFYKRDDDPDNTFGDYAIMTTIEMSF
jgi:hypothetical protein